MLGSENGEAACTVGRHKRRGIVAFVVAALMVAVTGLFPLFAATPAHAIQGDIGAHDPSIIKADGCYYAFSTAPGSISQRRTCDSTPATGWEYIGDIWDTMPGWITDQLGQEPTHIWAPDLIHVNGQYRLYYATSIPGDGYYAVLGLATATDIEGPWTDRGMLTDQNYPIDANVITEPDGRMYVMYGSWYGTYLHALDPATGRLAPSAPLELANGIEGTTIVKNGGYYYLFGSKGLCCSGIDSTYYTVVGRSTSITGPYLDQSGASMFDGGGTVVMRGSWPKVGAGGGDAFTDGSDTYLAYHYYDGIDAGRSKLDIRYVSYAGGWPVLWGPLNSASVHLVNNNSNLCADVWDRNTADGAPINQANCHEFSNQQWVVSQVGSDYRFTSVLSGKCLAVSGGSTASGAAAVQQTCSNSAAQLWTRTPTIGGYFTLTNVNSGQCLEIRAYSTAPGTALSQYTCNGGVNQQWLLV